MKKIGISLMVLALTVCFFGCGGKDTPATTPSDTNNTEPSSTVVPTMPDPTMDTNIPDPTVDSNSTENGSVLDDMITPDNNGGNSGNNGNGGSGGNSGNSGNGGSSGTGNAGMGNG